MAGGRAFVFNEKWGNVGVTGGRCSWKGCGSGCLGGADPRVETAILRPNASDVGDAGKLVWAGRSYDHLVQHERESERIWNYVEENPGAGEGGEGARDG